MGNGEQITPKSTRAIAQEIKDRLGESAALGNLENAYTSLGDYAKAIDYQQQRLAIATEIKARKGESVSLNNLGSVFYKSGKLAEAEKVLRTGIEVLKVKSPSLLPLCPPVA